MFGLSEMVDAKLMTRKFAVTFGLLLLPACGTSSAPIRFDAAVQPVPVDGSDAGDAGSILSIDAAFIGDAQPSEPTPEIFAHSATTLYKVNPDTFAVTTLGDFKGCDSSVIDLAINEDSVVYATTFGGVYKIDVASATCNTIAKVGSPPNALSFVPKGTVDPNAEALVGYIESSYMRIDTTSGLVTTIGAFSLTGGYTSSGDLVSVKGGSTYLTVKGPNCVGDCLVEVNPTTGAMVKNLGSLKKTDVFGLAFWRSTVFGFTNGGQLFKIEPSSLTVTDIPLPNALSGLSFWGAGSTTSAPIGPR